MKTGRVDARVQAALDLAGTYVFGTEPGRIPAVLFEAYDAATDDGDRARLASALARCWAYASQRQRAVPFAVAAVRYAESAGDPVVLADALDAALATHWGPDELEVRVDLAGKLADATAHLLEVDARIRAHRWLLSVAAETLDMAQLNRQMRALEVLGEESPVALFFAASRRLALDLMRGRTDTIAPLVAIAEEHQDLLPDGYMVVYCMVGYGAVQAGDRSPAVLARVRAGEEELALAEGIRVVYAELAWMYLGLGLPDDARRLAETFDERVLAGLPHDHNFLLTLQLLLDVALETGLSSLVEAITPLLLPYAGRAVINAGFVAFHGVTDDTLSRACAQLGDTERAAALREQALDTYRRIGATWWRERLEARAPLVSGAVFDQSDLGEVVDAQALAAYKRRLVAVDAELDQADLRADAARGEELAAERTALLAELSAATGLGGRRRVSGSGAERARVTVKKAITSAIEAVHAVDPVVARHLTRHVRTGTRCCYEPDPEHLVDWRL